MSQLKASKWIPLDHVYEGEHFEQRVYIFQFSDFTKIGISKDPHLRKNTIAPASGRIFENGWVLSGIYNASTLERHLHNQFSDYRQKGEWFNFSARSIMKLAEFDLTEFPIRLYTSFEKSLRSEKISKLFQKVLGWDKAYITPYDLLEVLAAQALLYFHYKHPQDGFELLFDEIFPFAEKIIEEPDGIEQLLKYINAIRSYINDIKNTGNSEAQSG